MCDELCNDGDCIVEQAIETIKTLVAEREAAIDDLKGYAKVCITCCHSESNNKKHKPCAFKNYCMGEHWEWRGAQEE